MLKCKPKLYYYRVLLLVSLLTLWAIYSTNSKAWHIKQFRPGTRPTAENVKHRPYMISVDEHTVDEHTVEEHRPFMISVLYAEQLTNAFVHYNEFVSLASRWNFTAVEPFVQKSRIFGFQTKPNRYEINKLFNMQLFQQRFSTNCFGTKYSNTSLIEPMDFFLKRSFRKIIVVYFSLHMFSLPRYIHKTMDASLKDVFSKHEGKSIVNCMYTARSANLTTFVEDLLRKERLKSNYHNARQFSVTDVLCVNRAFPLSLDQLMDQLADSSIQHSASVFFASWQGQYTTKFADLKFMSRCVLPFTEVPFSSTVQASAIEFVQSKGFKPNEYISVHIRFEKLFEFAFHSRKSNQTNYYKCCMNRLQLLLETLSNRTKIPLTQTLLIHDMGANGSDSCHFQGHWKNRETCLSETSKLLPMLKVSASEYSTGNKDSNTGFVSLVEQASVLNGRVLVTLGGGSFQASLVHRYTSNDIVPAKHLHYSLCMHEYLQGIHIDHALC